MQPRTRQSLKPGLQLAAMLVVALAFVYATIAAVSYAEEHWAPDRSLLQMTIFTIVIFPPLVWEHRHLWRSRWFWLAAASLFGVHLALCATAWSLDVQWPTVTYAAAAIAEILLAQVALDTLGIRVHRQSAPHAAP